MANYKETTISGTAWNRAFRVTIENAYNTVPTMDFDEEKIISLADNQFVSQYVGKLKEKFSDPTVMFDLIHPETGAVVGTASYMDIYIMLSSLYLSLAAKRDLANEPVVVPADPPPQDPPV